MTIPFKSSPVEFNQHLLFPSNIFDLLPKDNDCYLYTELFQMLDTSTIESSYQVKGQNAYHPKLIVSCPFGCAQDRLPGGFLWLA